MRVKTIFLFGLSILMVTSFALANDYQLEEELGLVEIQTNDAAPNAGPIALFPPMDTQWDVKLDARLAKAIMSIQAIVGVEIGLGFASAERWGSRVQDEIFYEETNHQFYHT